MDSEFLKLALLLVGGLLTWAQLQSRQRLKTVTAQVDEQAARAEQIRKEADERIIRAQTDANQAKSSADTVQTIINAFVENNKAASDERREATVIQKQQLEAQKQLAAAIENNTASTRAQTQAVQAQTVRLEDIDDRIGEFAKDTKSQTDKVVSEVSAANEALKAATQKMDDIPRDVEDRLRPLLQQLPADIEAKIKPLLDKLIELDHFADDVRTLMRDEIEKIETIVKDAVQAAQMKGQAA